ncbi:hypothetical protein DMJ37_16890 [Vibrio parahaemolyticus]|nr:hypothetical protein [Vibrio parahaemolyticus]
MENANWKNCEHLLVTKQVRRNVMKTQEVPCFIKLEDVIKMVAMSKPTIYRKMKSGTFPPNRKQSTRAVAWDKDEVIEWMRNRPRSTPQELGENR